MTVAWQMRRFGLVQSASGRFDRPHEAMLRPLSETKRELELLSIEEGVATGKSLHLPQNPRQPGIGRRLDLAKELIAKHSDAWRKFANNMDRYCPWE